jgi:hypothetical protein
MSLYNDYLVKSYNISGTTGIFLHGVLARKKDMEPYFSNSITITIYHGLTRLFQLSMRHRSLTNLESSVMFESLNAKPRPPTSHVDWPLYHPCLPRSKKRHCIQASEQRAFAQHRITTFVWYISLPPVR